MKLLYSILFFSQLGTARANDTLDFRLSIPKSINEEKLVVMLDDCKEESIINISFKNHHAIIKRRIYGKFATLTVVYPNMHDKHYGVRLWVKPGVPSSVKFNEVDPKNNNLLASFSAINATDINNRKEYKRIRSYCLVQYKNYENLSKKYNKIKTDSILNLYNKSSVELAEKQLEYIKKNGKDYYNFWLFRKEIVPTLLKTKKQELYDFFNSVFIERFRESIEGYTLRQYLEGYLFIKRGAKSPEFLTISHDGQQVSTSDSAFSYILLNFWASWCIPCIQKIPELSEIQTKYQDKGLTIIGITEDSDTTAFLTAVKKYNMNWIHVYNDKSLINMFGNTAIPALYLIGPDRKILFSSWEDNLDTLKQILKKALEDKTRDTEQNPSN